MAFRTSIFLLFLLAASCLAGAETKSVRSLRELREAFDSERPFHTTFDVTGRVAVIPPDLSDEFTLSDDTAHVVLTDDVTSAEPKYAAGDLVRATGILRYQDKGSYNFGRAETIEVLSRGKPVQPRDVDVATVAHGDLDGLLVRTTGTVLDVFRDEIDTRFVFIVLSDRGNYAYLAAHYTNDLQRLSTLKGARISATGICRKYRPGRHRSHLGVRLFVDAEKDLRILIPKPADPYDVPVLKGNILDIRKTTDEDMPWRKLSGTVLVAFRRHQALLKNERGEISHITFSTSPSPRCGEFIEAVGMPETDIYHLNLSSAIWRKADGAPSSVDPTVDISADVLLTDGAGRRQIKPELHGRPIRMRGLVTHLTLDTADAVRLTLENKGTEVPVEFGTDVPPPTGLERGCIVEVTGVCLMETDNWRPQVPFPSIRNVSIIVRQTDNVRLLETPPWWTARRLLTVIGILVAALVGILVWNVLLQRLSDRKGRALARARLASSESLLKVQERTRLATELHDTIVQNLTGASMELRTASRAYDTDRETSRQQLGLALKTLDSCRNEIRNCIWDLRSRALDETNMDAAIRRTLSPFEDDAKLSVRFAVPRDRLTDNTAHALICIVRELVINAIRHGKAKTIRIAGCIEDEKLLFSVQDDGCGFDPKVSPGVGQGHFGLQGIQERIDALHGTMSVTSAIGTGAHAAFAVPLSSEGKN